jgi:CRP-like cAMP-binding protein
MIDIGHYIATLETFQELSTRERETLSIVLVPRTVPQGEDLYTQGERATSFFIIAKGGFVKVKEYRAHLAETLGTIGTGDLVGLLSMFDRSDRLYSVKATEESIVLECTRDNFDRLFESQSVFSYKILESFAVTLSRNVREANHLVASVFSDPQRTLLKLNQALVTARKQLSSCSLTDA